MRILLNILLILSLSFAYSQKIESEYLTFATEKECKECVAKIDKSLGFPNAVADTYAKCREGQKKVLGVFNIDCYFIEIENWIKEKPVIKIEGKLKDKKDIKYKEIE